MSALRAAALIPVPKAAGPQRIEDARSDGCNNQAAPAGPPQKAKSERKHTKMEPDDGTASTRGHQPHLCVVVRCQSSKFEIPALEIAIVT